MLAVNGLEQMETIAETKKKVSFPILARKERDLLPERLYRAIGTDGIFVIDQDGRVLFRGDFVEKIDEKLLPPHIRAMRQQLALREPIDVTEEALRSEVEKALKGQGGSE